MGVNPTEGMTPEQRASYWLDKVGKQPSPTQVITPPTTPWDADLIPEVPYERTEEDRKLDGFLELVDVVEAYRTFCGKMEPKTNGKKTEGIMISCPLPGHPDANPSAWLNSEKGTWFCGGCQVGGDSYDLAAIQLGYPLEGYKHNGTFPKLRREMAERLGFTVMRTISGGETFLPPQPDIEAPIARIGSEPEPIDYEEEVVDLDAFRPGGVASYSAEIGIDWETMLPTDTFLRRWMEACSITDVPHEYHFFNGLMALGLAGGSNIILQDDPPVKSNLLVCLYGRTGAGKTRSTNPLIRLIEEVLPFTATDHFTTPSGVKMVPTPGSPEVLLDHFQFDLQDSSTMKVTGQAQIKGIVNIDELSAFIATSARPGSAFTQTIMQMFDAYRRQVTTSSRKSGTVRAFNPYMQMLTSTQPASINTYLTRSNVVSGFLNRWIWAFGERRRGRISYGGVQVDITDSAASLRHFSSWAATARNYTLTGDAYECWDEFFQGPLALLTESGLQAQTELVARVDLIFKKLILLLSMNEHLDQPSLEIVQRVISLLPYFRSMYRQLGVALATTPEEECQDRILYTIKSIGGKEKRPVTKTHLINNIRSGGRFDRQTILKALTILDRLGLIEEIVDKPVSRGRPATRFSLAEWNG